MGWPFIPIARIKVSQMARYKGLCICDGEEFYIVLSEKENHDNHSFFSTLIHELIHAVLWMNKKTAKHAHKHKGDFKNMCRDVAYETNNFYTIKDILK